jgi:ABC-type transporter Mla maintaining outer membrane lipid asymmetry ATPase subunit MlaF
MLNAVQRQSRLDTELRPAISVGGMTYAYPGQDRPAVDDVSFEVREGEIFGLLGPSCAGKTTTQRVLTRQQRNFAGNVEVLGRPLDQWGRDYFEEIGVGFELPNHYLKFTALENLEFFASLYTKQSRDPLELLALVGLAGDAKKKVDAFSKGMRMRLNFIRAFQHDPRLLFLDEPTAGLAGNLGPFVRLNGVPSRTATAITRERRRPPPRADCRASQRIGYSTKWPASRRQTTPLCRPKDW